MKKITLQDITTVGIMAAMVFVATFIKIDIPTPLGKTMLHFGNVVCLMAALLFGAFRGGLSAGIGSFLFDLVDPVFAPEAPITFIMKFIMAFVCGTIAFSTGKNGTNKRFNYLAAASGAAVYVSMYILKTILTQYFLMSKEWQVVAAVVLTKGTVSLVNGIVAALASVIIAAAVRPALLKTGMFSRDK